MADRPDNSKIDHLTDLLKKARPAGPSAKPGGRLFIDRRITISKNSRLSRPLAVVPYETCFEMHTGGALFSAPLRAEPGKAIAPNNRQDI
jgi:hypothetical protein